MLTNKHLQEEVVFEEVSEQAGHSYCGPAGGYEDIAECRKTRTERQPVPAIVLGANVQQRTCTYSVSSKKASHVRASVLWAPGGTCAEFRKQIKTFLQHVRSRREA